MHPKATNELDVSDRIVAFKRSLAPQRDALKRAFVEVKDHVSRAVEAIRADAAAGRPVVPEVDYRDINENKVSDETRIAIRKTGCAVVRGVFPASVASGWFAELGAYLETNHYEEREIEKRSLDKYFSALKAGKPQIFNVYWSKPQVMARQDAKLAETRAFLDRLWTLRRRLRSRPRSAPTPTASAAASPATRPSASRRTWTPARSSAGSIPATSASTSTSSPATGAATIRSTAPIGWRRSEIPSPAVCSMFRTYQGWTALTRQGPNDGTLRLIPIAEGISYVLLRALQDDVAEDRSLRRRAGPRARRQPGVARRT